MRIRLLAISAALLALITPALAGDDSSIPGTATAPTNGVSVTAVFGRYGFSSSPHVTASACTVDMELNQKSLIENFPELQKLGLMNQDISETTINMEPNMLSLGFAVQMLPVATREVYDNNKDADHCEFTQSISVVDDYGNDKKVLMLSYWFTRTLYKKINWDQFPAQNMMKVAPRFHIEPTFAAKIIRERENAN